MSSNNLNHRELTKRGQEHFIGLYQYVVDTSHIFKYMISSDIKSKTWICLLLIFINASVWTNLYIVWSGVLFGSLAFCLGILSLQIIFVGSHMEAHALFLEYGNHYATNLRCVKPIVYYYAFYHHHHTKNNNWAPQLSFYTEKGIRGITVAHWHSYTMLLSSRIFLVAFFSWLSPILMFYFVGYECAVYILPYAHGWQHMHKKKLGTVPNLIIPPLIRIGLIAGSDQHKNHHNHNHSTVFQSFSSSGIYSKKLDRWLDSFWNNCFHKCWMNDQNLYDMIHPYVYLTNRLIILGVPLTLYFGCLF